MSAQIKLHRPVDLVDSGFAYGMVVHHADHLAAIKVAARRTVEIRDIADKVDRANAGLAQLNSKLRLHIAAMAAASAYDEEKERAFFEADTLSKWPHARMHRRDALPESDPLYGWYVDEFISGLWQGWLACAKARSKAAGCL